MLVAVGPANAVMVAGVSTTPSVIEPDVTVRVVDTAPRYGKVTKDETAGPKLVSGLLGMTGCWEDAESACWEDTAEIPPAEDCALLDTEVPWPRLVFTVARDCWEEDTGGTWPAALLETPSAGGWAPPDTEDCRLEIPVEMLLLNTPGACELVADDSSWPRLVFGLLTRACKDVEVLLETCAPLDTEVPVEAEDCGAAAAEVAAEEPAAEDCRLVGDEAIVEPVPEVPSAEVAVEELSAVDIEVAVERLELVDDGDPGFKLVGGFPLMSDCRDDLEELGPPGAGLKLKLNTSELEDRDDRREDDDLREEDEDDREEDWRVC